MKVIHDMKLGRFMAVIGAALAVLAGGCVQLEYRIALHENDGGATVTERIAVLQALQDLDAATPPDKKVAKNLEKEAVLERMKTMGKDIRLTGHKLARRPDGALESVAIFEIPNIEDLVLVNPLLDGKVPHAMMRLRLSPGRGRNVDRRRWVTISAEFIKKADRPSAPGDSPLNLQIYRDLAPAYADLMKGLQVAVLVETPTPISGGTARGAGAGARVAEVFSFTSKDLTRNGLRFLDDEEAMLSILRVDPFSSSISTHTSAFVVNTTVPVMRTYGLGHPNSFNIELTAYFEKKYFGQQTGGKP